MFWATPKKILAVRKVGLGRTVKTRRIRYCGEKNENGAARTTPFPKSQIRSGGNASPKTSKRMMLMTYTLQQPCDELSHNSPNRHFLIENQLLMWEYGT